MGTGKHTMSEARRLEALTNRHDPAQLQNAENLLCGLTGVVSARIVADPETRLMPGFFILQSSKII